MSRERYAKSVAAEVAGIHRATWPLFADRQGDGRLLLGLAARSRGLGIACGVLADYIDEGADCPTLTDALRDRLGPGIWPLPWGREWLWLKRGSGLSPVPLLSTQPGGPAATLWRTWWRHWDTPAAGTIRAGDWFTSVS